MSNDFIEIAPLGVCIYFDLKILDTVDALIFKFLANSILVSGFNSAETFNKKSAWIWHIKVPTL